MAVSGAPADVLLQTPWLPVNIDGCRLLAKSWFGETAYHVLLTDVQDVHCVHCVWEEQMDAAGIHSRAQVNQIASCHLHLIYNGDISILSFFII